MVINMISDYWIKRVEQLETFNRKLEKENERLYDLVLKYAPHCGYYDGSICINIQGHNYGHDCECPWENDCYNDGD